MQTTLVTAAGILSGFAISYLAAKIFNIRAEREKRKKEIDKYSERITDFRRILFYVMKSREFWICYDDIAKFKKKYPGLTYEELHTQNPMPERAYEVWSEEELSTSTIDL